MKAGPVYNNYPTQPPKNNTYYFKKGQPIPEAIEPGFTGKPETWFNGK